MVVGWLTTSRCLSIRYSHGKQLKVAVYVYNIAIVQRLISKGSCALAMIFCTTAFDSNSTVRTLAALPVSSISISRGNNLTLKSKRKTNQTNCQGRWANKAVGPYVQM